ncbi:MAG TPA: VanZ family protein [Bryobacteraceae bacterium]|nr:VanZ family protein [Bryobacteraceae bacterium]
MALIAHGTLYPWNFVALPVHPVSSLFRLSPATGMFALRDIVVNIAIYIPLGAVCFLQWRSRGSLPSVAYAVLCGSAVSFSLEGLQLFCPGRNPSANDVLTNTFGAFAGAAAAMLIPMTARGGGAGRPAASSITSITFLSLWVFAHLAPGMPHLSRHALTSKLQSFWQVDTTALLAAALSWFLAGAMLRQAGTGWLVPTLFASTLLIPLQLLLVTRRPQLGSWIGAVAGCFLHVALGRRAGVAAGVALGLLLLSGFAPFEFSATPNVFTWRPFGEALAADWLNSTAVTSGKFFISGAAIVSLMASGWRLTWATGMVAAVSCITEVAQVWLVDRSPATTDPVIAVIAGVVLHLRKRLS